MTTMDQIHRIRNLYYVQDKSLTEIARMEKLDQFKPIIDRWLTEDKKTPRKQRHTALRVHRRLKNEVEGYDCSYRLTASL